MGPFLCKGGEGGGGARVHHMSPNRKESHPRRNSLSLFLLSLSLPPLYLSPDNARRASGHFSLAAAAASLVALSTIDFGRRRLRSERARSLFRLGGRGHLARVAVPRARAQRPRAWRPPRGGHRAHVVRRPPRAMPMHACLAASEPAPSSFFYPSQD